MLQETGALQRKYAPGTRLLLSGIYLATMSGHLYAKDEETLFIVTQQLVDIFSVSHQEQEIADAVEAGTVREKRRFEYWWDDDGGSGSNIGCRQSAAGYQLGQDRTCFNLPVGSSLAGNSGRGSGS